MDQTIATLSPMEGDLYPCEVCGEPARWAVQDMLVVQSPEASFATVHSSHRFCEAHMRPPIHYARGTVELRQVREPNRFLGRNL